MSGIYLRLLKLICTELFVNLHSSLSTIIRFCNHEVVIELIEINDNYSTSCQRFRFNVVMLNVIYSFRLKTAVAVAVSVAVAVGSVGRVPHNSSDRCLLFTSPQRL